MASGRASASVIRPAPAVEPLLPRPRLDALLDAGRDQPLTLVVACAGSGKRTAVRGWLARSREVAAWVPASGTRPDLAGEVAGALAAADSVTAGRFRAALAERAARPDPATVADALRTVAGRAPLRLLLDAVDGELAPGPAALVAALATDPHPALRLVVVARIAPDLPLARLRLAGGLNIVGPDALAFTPGEAGELLGRRGLLADRIVAETEGWAAGVAMLARDAVEATTDPGGAPDLERGHRWLDAFVREELLAPLAGELRDLLVRTAPLNRLEAADAAAALDLPPGQGRRLLDRLLAADLAYADGTGARVRAVLRRTLRRRYGELPVPEAGPVAARLAAGLGDERSEEAIRLLLAAGDVDGAAAHLARVADSVMEREIWPRLEALVACFPEPVAATRPEVLAVRLWVAHLTGRFAATRELAERIAALDAALPADDPGRVVRAAQVAILCTGSLVPVEREPAQSLALLDGLADRLAPGNRPLRAVAAKQVALALHGVGRGDEAVARLTAWSAREADRADGPYARGVQALCFVHWQAGNLVACRQAAEHLLEVAAAHQLPIAAGWARRFLGRLAREQGRPREAADWYRPVATDSRGHHAGQVEAVVGLALSLDRLGDSDAARRVLAEATTAATRERAVHLLAIIRATDGLLAVRSGRADPAAGVRVTAGAAIDQVSLHAEVHPLTARVELLVRDGTPEALAEAARHVAALRQRATGCRHVPALVQADTLAAALALRQGDPAAALAALDRAAGPGLGAGMRQTFRDLAPLLRPLARPLPAKADDPRARLQALLVQSAAAPGDRKTAWSQPSPLELLTVREAEVLALAGRGLTSAEIAAALSVAPATVKFHLSGVYAKLGVADRRHALRRAADLGWDLGAPAG